LYVIYLQSLSFQPFEDILSVGYTDGFASMIVPGAGEPNFDSYEANPYETKNQRREATVHNLLDKLRPDMITIDNNLFGTMNSKSKILYDGTRAALREAEYQATLDKEVKNRTRGRNSSAKRFKRRHANITDKQTTHFKDQKIAQQKQIEKQDAKEKLELTGQAPSALSRFSR
jgi:U3 small nucleolar RNA-associated protein 7